MDLENVFRIARIISSNGGRLYIVGGAVRDEIMGLIPTDFDFCVTGLSEEKFKFLFPIAREIGKFFPVFYIKKHEFALARKEKKIANGHNGFEVEATDKITILEDLKRRDFTINAIAKDVLTGVFIDPFDGANDIKQKTLRHISSAFVEDPLRVYRAARFAATLDFKIHHETKKLMESLKEELIYLSKERIFNELQRALQSDSPSLFFHVLKDTNLLEVHFKELYDLQNIKNSYENDIYHRSMLLLDKVAKVTKDISLRYCALTLELWKPLLQQGKVVDQDTYEEETIKRIGNFSNRISIPTIWKNKAIDIARYYKEMKHFDDLEASTIVTIVNKIHRSTLSLEELELIINCDTTKKEKQVHFAKIGNKMLKEITGKKLIEEGINPDEVGIEKFKQLLFNRQIDFINEEK
ncbi:MAG: polynucleotide adenylyltransferase [Clostridia bacterium]|nr:polynucleotide adenylyltransferase [Clostridia bacterium]